MNQDPRLSGLTALFLWGAFVAEVVDMVSLPLQQGWIIRTTGEYNSGNFYSIFCCEQKKISMNLHQSLQNCGPRPNQTAFVQPTQCFTSGINDCEGSHTNPDYWLLFWKIWRAGNSELHCSNGLSRSSIGPFRQDTVQFTQALPSSGVTPIQVHVSIWPKLVLYLALCSLKSFQCGPLVYTHGMVSCL